MQLLLDTDKKELKSHGTYGFPVSISYEQLSRYERKSFSWHWHKEIELTLILQGEMNYQINDSVYHLKAGEGLFCNSNALHTGFSYHDSDCIYLSTTFHPRFLFGYEGSILHSKYVKPLLDSSLDSLVFSPQLPWQEEILGELKHIRRLSLAPSLSFEWEIQQSLSLIWGKLWENTACDQETQDLSALKHMERLKKILSYLQEHYMEKLTLADISAQVNICPSECCRFFKKYMKESLFAYLLAFRIEKSLPLLSDPHLSITEISNQVGFASSSYYTKIFREQMGCSPSQYRLKSCK